MKGIERKKAKLHVFIRAIVSIENHLTKENEKYLISESRISYKKKNSVISNR